MFRKTASPVRIASRLRTPVEDLSGVRANRGSEKIKNFSPHTMSSGDDPLGGDKSATAVFES